jgi:hypothetical protein
LANNPLLNPSADGTYRADPAILAFEWRDEWWKGNERYPYFHSVSGNQQCGVDREGCPSSCHARESGRHALRGRAHEADSLVTTARTTASH